MTLLLLLPLAGCHADQKAQLGTCEKSPAKALPTTSPASPFKQIQACLDQAGYRFIGWNDGVICDMSPLVQDGMSSTGSGADVSSPG